MPFGSRFIVGVVGLVILATLGWSINAARSGGDDQRAKLSMVYAIYSHPGCLTTDGLDQEVGYIVQAERTVRGAEMSDDAARAKIRTFVQAGIPNLWWVRFTLHPEEAAQWHGPKALPCSYNPNA